MRDLLLGTDILVTQHSTVTIEAAMLGMPVITVDFVGEGARAPYARLGLSLDAHNVDSIAQNLRRIISGGYRRSAAEMKGALEFLTGPLDGGSAKRCAELIIAQLSGIDGGSGTAGKPNAED
jgi:hypothetical protein